MSLAYVMKTNNGTIAFGEERVVSAGDLRMEERKLLTARDLGSIENVDPEFVGVYVGVCATGKRLLIEASQGMFKPDYSGYGETTLAFCHTTAGEFIFECCEWRKAIERDIPWIEGSGKHVAVLAYNLSKGVYTKFKEVLVDLCRASGNSTFGANFDTKEVTANILKMDGTTKRSKLCY